MYAEKPLTLTIAEARPLVKMARKYKRVLQTGTRQRSIPINRFASDLVRKGVIGKVQTVVECSGATRLTCGGGFAGPLGRPWRGPLPLRNFFECMRSRKRLNADVEIGHRSATVCHLINICRDLQRKLRWHPKAEKFLGGEEANGVPARPRRNGYELPGV